ncbi:unnamed protein product, partial [Sphacelaria rigidula]
DPSLAAAAAAAATTKGQKSPATLPSRLWNIFSGRSGVITSRRPEPHDDPPVVSAVAATSIIDGSAQEAPTKRGTVQQEHPGDARVVTAVGAGEGFEYQELSAEVPVTSTRSSDRSQARDASG